MARAYIALGANLGDRKNNIAAAVQALDATPGVKVTRVSALVDNPAVGGPADSPPFLNAAAELETELTPGALLARLLEIEKQLGRARVEKWGPRLIDLDLVLYDQEVLDEPMLQVPHPLMNQRLFVLQPLAEIAPDVMHPVELRTIRQLLAKLVDARAGAGE